MAAVVQKELISKIRSRNENQVHTFENGNHVAKPPVPVKKKAVGGQPPHQGWITPPAKPLPYREHVGKKKTSEETGSEALMHMELSSSPPDNPPSPSLDSSQMYAPVLAHVQTVPSSEGSEATTSQSHPSTDYEQNGTIKRTGAPGGGANKPHPHSPLGPKPSPPGNDMKPHPAPERAPLSPPIRSTLPSPDRLPQAPLERPPRLPLEKPTHPAPERPIPERSTHPPLERLPRPALERPPQPPMERPPLPPVGVSAKPPSPEKGRIPRESLRNVAGIKSLISQFDSQKAPPEATPVTPSPAPPKPPRRTTSNITEKDKIPPLVSNVQRKSNTKPPMGRKSSAPAQLEKIPQILSSLQQQDQLEPLSEGLEEGVTSPDNGGPKRSPRGGATHGSKLPPLGVHHQKQLIGQGGQDSGFSSDAEGAGGLHASPPTHTEERTGQSNCDSIPPTRFGFETREEKLRRSARRRGLFSDGHLMEQGNAMKQVPLNDRSPSYDDVIANGSSFHGNGVRSQTLESQASLTSDGYLKVLPGQAIPPAPPAARGTAPTADTVQGTLSKFPDELDVFMKALQGKDGKEKKALVEKRKHRKVIRNMSDPMLKALKVALDEEANRREPSTTITDRSVNVKRAVNNGKKADRTDLRETSPTSPPSTSKGKSLVAKVTRLVRGKKDEVSPKKTTAASSSPNKVGSVIGKASEIAAQIQESCRLDNISDPHRKVWRNRMDLCVPPPVPPPRYNKEEIYEYVKMPFRRNVRVSVKYAGLQAVKSVPAIKLPVPGPAQCDDSEESPPPIYPKSRSIKRSILLNQGRDVTAIKDWNRSLADLLSESYPPSQPRQRARSSSEEAFFSSTLQPTGEEVLPHPEEATLQRSTSYPDISDELQNGGYDPYYLMLGKPSLKQRLLSTSVEVLCRIHEETPVLCESWKLSSLAMGKSMTLPTSMQSKHRYENFEDTFSILNPGAEGLAAGSRAREGPSDDYIKMQRKDFAGMNKKDFPRRKSDGGFFPGTQKTEKTKQRYMNIWEAADAIKEDPEDDGIPDYIRMHAPSVNQGGITPPSPDQEQSAEDYIWCQQGRDSTIANEEYLVREGEEEQQMAEGAKDTKNSYMNWMDVIDDFFSTAKDSEAQLPKKEATEKNDGQNPTTPPQTSQQSIATDDRNDTPHRPLPPIPFSIYSTLLPEGEGIEGPVEEGDKCYDERDEYIAQKRGSVIIKNTQEEEEVSKGDRYMNIADAELTLSADAPGSKQKPSIIDKLPMPSPRKASLSRRRPLNVLHPGIPFSELPTELKETNLQCQRQSTASIYSVGSGENSTTSGNPPPGTPPNGLCVICSAHEEFTHMGGILKPREECGIYIEVPKDAIKKNSTQKLWFVACYDTQYPGGSWQKAGTLGRNTTDEIQLLEQDRNMKSTTVSPIVYIGPSTADLVKPLRIHLPHCISFPESSVKCWLEAKCYEMPRWAVVCQRPFFHTPPKSKEFNDPSYKPNIVFQMAPSSATIKTCYMGWFRIGASAFRGTSKAAKQMFAGVFQRLPNDFNPKLNTISEEGDDNAVLTEQKKKETPKNELLVVISNSLPYVGEVIQWLLEKGTNKYVCLERYMPFKYCANGRDLEVILYGESSRAPIQTTSVPFGNLWRMKNIGEGWQTLTVRSPEKYQEQTLTFQLKQGEFHKQYTRNMRMHDVNDSKV